MSSVERVQYTIKATPQEVSPEVDFIDRDAYYNVQQENILFMQQSAAEDRSQATGGSSDANGAATEVPFPRSDEELLRSGWPWAGGVMFSDVHMRYREDFAPVLKGLDLTIQPGERVGIVGRTGSGKSSIFRCLMRLNEIESGKIYMDGVDISAVGLGTLRSSISVIPQDPVLFSGSIRSNPNQTPYCARAPLSAST